MMINAEKMGFAFGRLYGYETMYSVKREVEGVHMGWLRN